MPLPVDAALLPIEAIARPRDAEVLAWEAARPELRFRDVFRFDIGYVPSLRLLEVLGVDLSAVGIDLAGPHALMSRSLEAEPEATDASEEVTEPHSASLRFNHLPSAFRS